MAGLALARRSASTPAGSAVGAPPASRASPAVRQLDAVKSLLNRRPPTTAQRVLAERTSSTSTATLPSGGAVVQRVLSAQLLASPDAIHALEQQALAYNALSHAPLQQRLDAIEQLLRSTLTWLDVHAAPDQEAVPAGRWARALLNDIQDEHRALVQENINAAAIAALNPHAAPVAPPVAGFAGLPQHTQTDVTTMWNHLRSNLGTHPTGNVRINPDPSDNGSQQFIVHSLAQFARLLETPTGRGIVAKSLADTGGHKLVTIRHGLASNADEFAAGPVPSHGWDYLAPGPVAPGSVPNVLDVDAMVGADTDAKVRAIYGGRANQHNQVRMNNADYHYGPGSAVEVTVTRDVSDASTNRMARFVNAQGNEIPSPNFITMGHELGHGNHMIDGSVLLDPTVNSHILAHANVTGQQAVDWSGNAEEYGNIRSTENALRAEYGLGERYGHVNQYFMQKTWHQALTGSLMHFSTLCLGQQHNPAATALATASTEASAEQFGQSRARIAATIKYLQDHLKQSHPTFHYSERRAISNEIGAIPRLIAVPSRQNFTAAQAHVAQATTLINQANAARAPGGTPPARSWTDSFAEFFGY